MIIELRGVEFHNKGAELMLKAIVEKVTSKYPDARFVMAKKYGASINQIKDAGFFVKLNFKKYGINTELIGKFLPKKLRRKLGFVLEDEIDVILEGSGFAFGDFFGAKKVASKLTDHLVKWKSNGSKVIMLPQAFGPFTTKDIQNEMEKILRGADLIFARDKYSLEYLKGINGDHNNVFLKPDFTNLVLGKNTKIIDSKEKIIAVIPNNKLIESGVFKDRSQYLEVLTKIILEIKRMNFVPIFLIHEGEKDLMLAKDVNSMNSLNVKIVKEEDPLIVKGIIGQLSGLVTSRFHGLVSGLAQAIPSLCIGWSHKYKALLEDYNYGEALISIEDLLDQKKLSEKLQLICEGKSREGVVEKLEVSSKIQKLRSEEMWSQVFSVIDSK